MTKKKKHLVIVANRLPVRQVSRKGKQVWETSPGGLVSALQPFLQKVGGAWVGWPGTAGTRVPKPFEHDGIVQWPVAQSEAELKDYYYGFCNGTLWPLYHDAVRTPEYHRHWWRPYLEMNRRFAAAAADALRPEGTAWVQDYHLQLVPGMLRELRPDARIGFFLHIPFPPVELFAQLPWRQQIIEGLLGADVLGLQTRLGAQNFQRAARRFAETRTAPGKRLEHGGREVRVDRFPISIDVQRYEELARDPDVAGRAKKLRGQLGEPRRLVLGVDRLDYTKGIDIRLRAFETLLRRHPDSRRRVTFVQVAVPSRERVPEYAQMRTRIERLVGRINGTYGDPPRVPVHYLHRSLPTELLTSYYLAADIMVVTPLRDGMNLVAKEYAATRIDDSGVLVLSEFAGAAEELRQAIQVNPHDVDGVAEGLKRAIDLPREEARRRMKALRRALKRNDVHRWASSFLEALEG